MAESSQTLWISPFSAKAVKLFEATLGRLPTPNINLRLVNGLPSIQLSPLLQKCDILNCFLAPVFCLFLITLLLLLENISHLTGIQVVQLITLATGLPWSCLCSLVRRRIQQNNEFVFQMNIMFQSNPTGSSLAKQFTRQNSKIPLHDLPGLLLLILAFNSNALGIPICIIFGFIGVGPIQATLEQVFHFQSNIYTLLLDATFLTFMIVYVSLRENFIAAFAGMNLLIRINAELVALSSYPMTDSAFVCSRNILLCRQYLRIANDMSMVTGYVILFTQVFLCTCIWLILIGSKLIPLYIVGALIVVFFVTLGVMVFALQSQAQCRVCSDNLIRRHLDGFHVYGIRGGPHGYWKRMWKCQRPLRIYCGKQFVIGKDAAISYMHVLSNNATNAVVLIKI